ncbi:MAG: D-glycero-beta-D-manno-heptose-1,7-bisphosphate 7-phosphatase [Gammaproteobacteria bacterium RBG_16_57_12]|nr:MAG: D-glycero-beta-D-manno-heptose-1,7-bisphosphate 7-phosphatase [Gammaproteobacteria bacterium RBG_16_57_12]
MKWIILDRDGVINYDSDDYIRSVEEFVFIPGSVEAITRLCKAGYRVVVATNQSGVARGYFDLATLEAIHARLRQALAEQGAELAGIFYCPHGPEDQCDCRKPRPGLMHQIARTFHIDLRGVPAIGDSLRDLQAAQAVQAKPILVRTGKGERTLARGAGLEGIPVYDDLAGAVEALLTADRGRA